LAQLATATAVDIAIVLQHVIEAAPCGMLGIDSQQRIAQFDLERRTAQ
jgi:hypothetical protein